MPQITLEYTRHLAEADWTPIALEIHKAPEPQRSMQAPNTSGANACATREGAMIRPWRWPYRQAPPSALHRVQVACAPPPVLHLTFFVKGAGTWRASPAGPTQPASR